MYFWNNTTSTQTSIHYLRRNRQAPLLDTAVNVPIGYHSPNFLGTRHLFRGSTEQIKRNSSQILVELSNCYPYVSLQITLRGKDENFWMKLQACCTLSHNFNCPLESHQQCLHYLRSNHLLDYSIVISVGGFLEECYTQEVHVEFNCLPSLFLPSYVPIAIVI